MSSLKYVLLLSAVVLVSLGGSQAATAHGDLSHPSSPGMCLLKNNVVLSPGTVIKAPDHPCASIQCNEGGKAVFTTCTVEKPPPGCRLRDYQDKSLPFPACCKRTYDCK